MSVPMYIDGRVFNVSECTMNVHWNSDAEMYITTCSLMYINVNVDINVH
jgi:hypothetical protein